ncbi:MAG: PDZ domain-containing protein [Lachnospiraceae bacterium]|nr:PDZ domain-containing protein [Lachnospiraceae bacterium]
MANSKNGFFRGVAAGIAFSVAGILATGAFLHFYDGETSLQSAVMASSNTSEETIIDAELIGKLQALQELVDEDFLMEAEDAQAFKDGIYRGFMSALGDPYSCYYNEEELAQLQESTSGVYSGIGVIVSQDIQTGQIRITKVFEGCPGAEAGLLPEDILVEADGMDVTAMDLSTAVTYIKGEEGTFVTIKVYRSTINDYVELKVERRSIEVPTVEAEMLEDSLGYIVVSEFDSVTADQFVEAIEELKAQGMEGLIVDVRDNPGGLLDVVVEMLDYMLPEGKIVYTEDKYGKGETFTSDAEHVFDLPLVVLTNENSASASEIFAGAIKDYGTGTIVGTTTFGKGIVQRIYSLGDGTAVKLTVSRYFTPNGVCIHELGIEPDVEIELNEELRTAVTISHEEDNQLQKAIEVLNSKIEE